MEHFISVNELSIEEIYSIFRQTQEYKNNPVQFNKQLFVANLFFEPSTRTKMSFIVAQKKLGLEALDFHSDTSSITKGETLYDTVKTFEALGANMVVIRHKENKWYEQLSSNLSIPIINAGAGTEEHPTQCILDLYTIYEEFGTFENINVVIAGDIKHSRVAHSDAHALKRLGANVYLSSAPGLEDPSLDFPYITMDEAVNIGDVMMLLRVQLERHEQEEESLDHYYENFGLTKLREQQMKETAIILHPAPINRGVEIHSCLVECDRSRIFKQMENGVYVRMAIMAKLFQKRGIINESII